MFETEGIAAPYQIIDDHCSSEVRSDEAQGNDIARCDERLGDTFIRSAAAAIAGNLRNIGGSQLRLGVLARVSEQLVCNLPGSGNPRVGKDGAMEGAWKIEIQNAAVKVCAIPGKQVEVGAV